MAGTARAAQALKTPGALAPPDQHRQRARLGSRWSLEGHVAGRVAGPVCSPARQPNPTGASTAAHVGNIARPADRQNDTLLMQEFRSQLDALGQQTGRRYALFEDYKRIRTSIPPSRPLSSPTVDWNLRTCARRGHVTYAPDEPDLRDRLHVASPVGQTWRCLRCGDYVVGEPRGHGPADRAPEVLRGRALRDLFILRLLAVERAARGLLIVLLAYAVLRFRSAQANLRELFERDLPAARPLADALHVNLDDSGVVHTIRHALTLRTSTLTLIAALLTAYALIEIVEGVGLWRAARWAEYLTVVATAAFLPLEVYELTEKVTWLRVAALIFNVAAVVYLLLVKRLFGLRGGRRAFDEERAAHSLFEVEVAAANSSLR